MLEKDATSRPVGSHNEMMRLMIEQPVQLLHSIHTLILWLLGWSPEEAQPLTRSHQTAVGQQLGEKRES